MASVGEISRIDSHYVEEIVPSLAWSEDSHNHYLIVDLPDFKIEDVRLEVDNSGHIMISGERLIHNDQYAYFDQKIALPRHADINNISGQFEGEYLYIIVPKRAPEELKQAHQGEHAESARNEHNKIDESLSEHDGEKRDETEKKRRSKRSNRVDSFQKEIIKKWGKDASDGLEMAMELLKRNKAIIVTAVIAFSLGVLLSHSLESDAK